MNKFAAFNVAYGNGCLLKMTHHYQPCIMMLSLGGAGNRFLTFFLMDEFKIQSVIFICKNYYLR